MKSAIIGHTGFVGQNLDSQYRFDSKFNSRNISEIRGQSYDVVVCSGVQAKKWWANQQPEADWDGIQSLLECLQTVQADYFVLISTVDVYPNPKAVDELTHIDPSINHTYGKNRYAVEEFVRARFQNSLVVRLPGLFGDGIKKNVVHDLLNQHELEKINPLGVFQYYYLKRLWVDIEKARSHRLSLINLATEAVSTKEILHSFFPKTVVGPESPFAANYDMRSRYADLWKSGKPGYLYSHEQVLRDLAEFIASYRH